jgi:ParB family chromosome partitioning protein
MACRSFITTIARAVRKAIGTWPRKCGNGCGGPARSKKGSGAHDQKKGGLGRGLGCPAGCGAAAAAAGMGAVSEADGQRRRPVAETLRLLPVERISGAATSRVRTLRRTPCRNWLPPSVQGMVQPVVVRPLGGDRYELIAGERRWRAAQLAGLREVPAVIREVPDQAAIAVALIENIQREDLNPLEEAVALQRLINEFR